MMVNEADMDFPIPGLPHSVVKHAQSTIVRQLIQKIENHPDRHTFQQDLRQNQSFNPFSPASKQMIKDVGNIELCELLETEPKMQCTVCLSYWNTGILYCTCGHSLHKERGSESAIHQFLRWNFFQSLSMSSRRGDLTATDMVKSQETRSTLRLTKWRKDARKGVSKESMTDSCEIQNSVVEWFQIIETKNFVDDGMLLRMKIKLTIWLHKNTLSIRANSGFIQISKVLILYDWRRDLISNEHCLPCIDCNEKQKETHKCVRTLTQVNNGHRVLLLHGAIGHVHGGLLIPLKVTMEDAPSIEWTEWPVDCSIWKDSSG